MCIELNSHMNTLVPGRENVYNSLSHLSELRHVLLAMDNDLPVGMATLSLNGETAEIRKVYVKPEHRGKGIAGIMCLELESIAKENGMIKIILDTWVQLDSAVKLYNRLGYTQYVGPIENDIDKFCIYMEKELI